MGTKRLKGAAAMHRNRGILRANPVCWICGGPIDLAIPYWVPGSSPRKVDPDAGVVDHKVALDKGGTEDPSNLAPAHARCNRDKSNKAFGSVIKRSGSLKH